MSLYNQLFGFNPMTAVYLNAIGLHPNQVGRLRDSYLFQDQGTVRLALFTRLGGGNRTDYQDNILQLQNHPMYVRDFDDDFDSTYATFVFNLPEGMQIPPEEVVRSPAQTPMARYQKLLKDMGDNKDNEDTRRALDIGRKIMSQIDFTKPGSGTIEI